LLTLPTDEGSAQLYTLAGDNTVKTGWAYPLSPRLPEPVILCHMGVIRGGLHRICRGITLSAPLWAQSLEPYKRKENKAKEEKKSATHPLGTSSLNPKTRWEKKKRRKSNVGTSSLNLPKPSGKKKDEE
jgi:hypothetical protein